MELQPVLEKARLLLYAAAKDPTTYTLLFSNIVAIYFILHNQVGIFTVIWVYWCQSTLLGISYTLHLRRWKEAALSFSWRYGFFHLMYFEFVMLLQYFIEAEADLRVIFYSTLAFLLHQLFMHFYGTKVSLQGLRRFSPYARIIPMHAVIILGAFIGEPAFLMSFLILKLIADVLMHVLEEHAET